jgi:hypothetical protein
MLSVLANSSALKSGVGACIGFVQIGFDVAALTPTL